MNVPPTHTFLFLLSSLSTFKLQTLFSFTVTDALFQERADLHSAAEQNPWDSAVRVQQQDSAELLRSYRQSPYTASAHPSIKSHHTHVLFQFFILLNPSLFIPTSGIHWGDRSAWLLASRLPVILLQEQGSTVNCVPFGAQGLSFSETLGKLLFSGMFALISEHPQIQQSFRTFHPKHLLQLMSRNIPTDILLKKFSSELFPMTKTFPPSVKTSQITSFTSS